MRPPLLNGIKWGYIGAIGTTYGLDQGPYSEEEEGGGSRRKEEKEEEENDGPLKRLALLGHPY